MFCSDCAFEYLNGNKTNTLDSLQADNAAVHAHSVYKGHALCRFHLEASIRVDIIRAKAAEIDREA